MKHVMFKYESKFGTTADIYFVKTRYCVDHRTAIEMICVNEEGEEPYASLTVNVAPEHFKMDDNTVCIDTNNLGKGVVEWLEDNGLFNNLGYLIRSGFCEYPMGVLTGHLAELPYEEFI